MSESSVSIQLQDGGTISALQRDGIITARGVPYASANRFEPPRPREKWEGVLDCTRPGPICPQPKSRLDALNGPVARGRAMSEDCLRVSVFAPAPIRTDELLPTMVWIHGGNYTTGAGDLDCYSGAGLAAKGGRGHQHYVPAGHPGVPADQGTRPSQPRPDGPDCRAEMGSGQCALLRRRRRQGLSFWTVGRG